MPVPLHLEGHVKAHETHTGIHQGAELHFLHFAYDHPVLVLTLIVVVIFFCLLGPVDDTIAKPIVEKLSEKNPSKFTKKQAAKTSHDPKYFYEEYTGSGFTISNFCRFENNIYTMVTRIQSLNNPKYFYPAPHRSEIAPIAIFPSKKFLKLSKAQFERQYDLANKFISKGVIHAQTAIQSSTIF